jgi:hypothetical protein
MWKIRVIEWKIMKTNLDVSEALIVSLNAEK